ncbi:hypothetical protein [Actinomadura oligospora]|uniref:hypothetical protein n=1 Tax=Actinomadura oligospora TaxID=111804 RepID=UPI0004B415ED|nr:hypothetical protein [Actinomadura oligospora]
MTEEISANSVANKRYRRLARIAYLILPEGLERHDRVVLAHWIVGRARHRRDHRGDAEVIYAGLRRRVLRSALRSAVRIDQRGPGAERVRSASWLRIQPLADGDPAALGVLAALSPRGRAAYALLRLEELPEDEARAELAALGVPGPDDALAEAAAVPPLGEAVVRALDPTVVRLHARRTFRPLAAARELRRRRGARVVLGAAVAVVPVATVGAFALANGGFPIAGVRLAGHPAAEPRGGRVVAAPDDLWRRSARLELTAWPARGDLVRDRAFVAQAVRAWEAGTPGAAAKAGGPQLLFAGTVGTSRVALLRDGATVARFTDGRLEVFPVGRSQPDGATPLKVAPGRYLLPPWVSGVRAADLASGGTKGAAAWTPVPVRDGLTADVPQPVPAPAARGCWRGPVLELSQPQVPDGRPYTVADLGGLVSANLLYQPAPPGPAWPHPVGGGPDALPAGFALWRRIGCSPAGPAALDRRGRGDVESATAREFWTGALPDGAGPGHWICARYAYTGGRGATYAVLLDDRGVHVTGRRLDTPDCSSAGGDLASAGWWRSPKGRWHYLAAASRRVTVLSAEGPFQPAEADHDFLAGRGPVAAVPPSGRIVVTARDFNQVPVPVYRRPGD